jgi:predicted nuclease of restriction endonuclease-like RecB superfamily
MLTANLVRARERDGELVLTGLKGARRDDACELGRLLLGVTTQAVGRTRAELESAYDELELLPRDKKLGAGLCKLLEDDCEFRSLAAADPEGLRREVFRAAASSRRALGPGEPFERSRVLEAVAEARGVGACEIDAALYADLSGEHELVRVPACSAEELVERYERAQVQAVLLRAVRLSAVVRCGAPSAYRTLFNQIKFRRLIHTIAREPDGRYRIDIDGPYSLFQQVTKYGLGLALVWPVLESSDEVELEARVLWGQHRRELVFRHRVRAAHATEPEAVIADEARALLEAFGRLETPWQAGVSNAILEVPGAGACVPDLEFRHPDEREPFHLELLGYHSRDAVWRRVGLVERGLPGRVLFAVSSRLRVSEEVLDGDRSAALYVFKGSMSARAVERHLEELRRRPRARSG